MGVMHCLRGLKTRAFLIVFSLANEQQVWEGGSHIIKSAAWGSAGTLDTEARPLHVQKENHVDVLLHTEPNHASHIRLPHGSC